jgi:hypothetical protein
MHACFSFLYNTFQQTYETKFVNLPQKSLKNELKPRKCSPPNLTCSVVLFRLNAFVSRERARRVISMDSYTGKGWGYFTHCAALCVLLAMAVCQAPLLYDSTVVYRGSLSSAVLACVVGAVVSVVHLFESRIKSLFQQMT